MGSLLAIDDIFVDIVDALERTDSTGDRELYDLHQDPYQLTNLVSTAEGQEQYADVVDGLAARTDEPSTSSGASCR
ncbi:MAG: hypothetical protein ACRCYU_14945 [Nocardioides sp.]